MTSSASEIHIVLVHPQIPDNVGNITRTALAMGAHLHLVGPFGFILDTRRLDRTSVGYWDELKPRIYADDAHFWRDFPRSEQTHFYWVTKFGEQDYDTISYAVRSVLLFGSEDKGVPEIFWDFKALPPIVSCRIPMLKVRCLNLATSVGIVGYEVLRQHRRQKHT